MAKRIITISREFGSGGRFIGEEVAKKLGIAYYDKDIIGQIAEQSGLSPGYIQENAELSPKKGLFAYAFSGRDITGKSVEDIVYEAQRKIIMEIAEKESGLPREEFFLTSKLNRNLLGYESAKAELEKTLKRLGTDYLDMYLLHWPRADYKKAGFDDWKQLDLESWRALEEMQKEGKIRSIGVSNFLPHHLDNLLAHASVVPAVNQLELHPGYMQSVACRYCKEHGIALEAWSPIGRGRLKENVILCEMAEKYQVSIPHLCLVYLHQKGIIILPKSSNYERMKENMILDDIEISGEDLWRLDTMPQAGWSGEHPDCERVYF